MRNKSRMAGINLIGLIISSAIGTFILAAIVKISFTVSDNLTLIKANAELEASARILDHFFSKVLIANGYNNLAANVNSFRVTANNIIFPLWFAGGNNNAITCSRELVPITQTLPLNVTLFLKRPTTLNAMDGYATCADKNIAPGTWATDNGSSYMPIVGKAQIADFYVVAIVTNAAGQMANFPITPANVLPANSYKAAGLKIAILLKSTSPVFNMNRPVKFINIFPQKTFSNTLINPGGDKFLYKLVIIQAPFVYAAASNTQVTISN